MAGNRADGGGLVELKDGREVTEIELTREYLMAVRQALLLQIDAIEKYLDIHPSVSELRKQAKEHERGRTDIPKTRTD